MNPKEQSRLDLMLRFRDVDVPRAAFWDNPTVAEINRRLDEADALRKENDELRRDKDKLLKDYAELKVNAALLVACDDALESLEAEDAEESEASHE